MSLMRKIQNFKSETPFVLQRQLSQLEDNASDAIDALNIATPSIPILAKPISSLAGGGSVYTVGQGVSVDTTLASVAIVLATPKSGNPGWFYLLKPSAAHGVTIGTTTGQLYGSAIITAAGVKGFFFDGVNWWSG